MVKDTIRNILFLAVGIAIGYFSGCNAGVKTVTERINNIVVDTLLVPIKVKVPITKVKTEYVWQTDTITERLTDSCFIEVVKNNPMEIPINVYSDTIETDEYTFGYYVGTVGEMMEFYPEIRCKPLVRILEPPAKNWTASFGVSSKLNCKVGLGYKGWMLEGDFRERLNHVYISKQFHF